MHKLPPGNSQAIYFLQNGKLWSLVAFYCSILGFALCCSPMSCTHEDHFFCDLWHNCSALYSERKWVSVGRILLRWMFLCHLTWFGWDGRRLCLPGDFLCGNHVLCGYVKCFLQAAPAVPSYWALLIKGNTFSPERNPCNTPYLASVCEVISVILGEHFSEKDPNSSIQIWRGLFLCGNIRSCIVFVGRRPVGVLVWMQRSGWVFAHWIVSLNLCFCSAVRLKAERPLAVMLVSSSSSLLSRHRPLPKFIAFMSWARWHPWPGLSVRGVVFMLIQVALVFNLNKTKALFDGPMNSTVVSELCLFSIGIRFGKLDHTFSSHGYWVPPCDTESIEGLLKRTNLIKPCCSTTEQHFLGVAFHHCSNEPECQIREKSFLSELTK